jgi:peptidyl-prolyl cis-trans isomerase D
MDRLIERELLAREAQRLGFATNDEDVHKMLLEGRVLAVGIPRNAPVQKEGAFDYEQFKSFAQFQLGQTPAAFIAEQRRELLAMRMRELLRSAVAVSPEEVKTDYEVKSRQVNLEYLRFPSRKFEAEVELTPAEVDAHVKANEAKLKETYEQRKAYYTNMPQEVRVRQILIKAPAEDDEAGARKRAEALGARLRKGERFADVAREASEDESSRASGGDLGWRRKGTLGLSTEDDDKLMAAKVAAVLGPFKKSEGFVLLSATATRQGTQSFDQVKAELAEEQLKQKKGAELAKRRAESALARAKAEPQKSLHELFPGPAAPAEEGAAEKTAAKPERRQGDKGKDKDKDKGDKKVAAAADLPPDTRAEETGLQTRRGDKVEPIGESAALAKAAFALTTEAPLAGPFDVAGSYVVVRLKQRKDPDPKEFEAKKVELERDAALIKWNEVMTEWVHRRCLDAKSQGEIQVNRRVLRYDDSQEQVPYEPCMKPAPSSRRDG